MNRGSNCKRVANMSGLCGFNEAPIHESGKFDFTPHRFFAIASFNEAPIHESGKYRPGPAPRCGRDELQ